MNRITTEEVLDLVDATGAPANVIVCTFAEAKRLIEIISPQPPKEAILQQTEYMLTDGHPDISYSTVCGEPISPMAMILLKLSGSLKRSVVSA